MRTGRSESAQQAGALLGRQQPLTVWSYEREYAEERTELLAAVERVFESGQLIMGKSLAGFEAEFASFHGTGRCVGVDNGTNALALSLRALGIGAGDEVITVSNTAAPTVVAIDAVGARPVLVDVEDNGGFLVDVAAIEAAITPKTACILVVHLYGQAAAMEPIVALARRRGLAVVEDCAQAHGATQHGKLVGTFGNVAAFSFYPTKVLGAYGDGGAIITGDVALADRLRQLRFYGMTDRYFVEATPGFNCRLDELQAEILRSKLGRLPRYLSARRAIAARYAEGLADTGLQLPVVLPGNEHAYYLYVVRHPKRDLILAELEKVQIRLNVSYRWPIHLMDGFRYLGMKPGDLPRTERLANEIFSLPMYPYLQVDDQLRVIDELRRIMATL
jgi:dTDP-3-amino-2,3,6-trideoxy-4-keto-D-glucose/dTDP-3-amino-3,4,6-trideoxy-alpha-D-glucose/dTDP-2,6-dideoxy-D-kanosamine transaminase